MFTEKNFKIALELMNFKKISDGVYQKNLLKVDFKQKKFIYPPELKVHRDGVKNFSQNENFVVFECVHRLLEKNYLPQDIEIEKTFKLGHTQKSGRADICVSHDEKILFIIECKTFGAEFESELENLKLDGGQLFSYRQQEISCQWLILYASTISNEEIIFNSKSVSCHEEIYQSAKNVQDFFKIWSEKFNKNLADDVIFHDETVAYKIGVKPFRKKDLQEFNDTRIVNQFEEILRHNHDSNKPRAFDVLIALFICKLADEKNKSDDQEVDFQFKFGADDYFIFQDRLQNLYQKGMAEFMNENIVNIPLSDIDKLFFQSQGASRKVLINAVKEKFRAQKFFTNNDFAFIHVHNEELFYKNSKILREVVDIFKDYKIIGAKNLQTLGDLFEQLLNKGFKQDEGQFFTPLPITRFIWDSLPLEKIISAENDFVPPKIIDYACGAGHFLTQGFEAVNDFTENKLPKGWENGKIFGIEKDERLSRVSKISLFMHGADEGKIKFGDGLENYSDEDFTPQTFDILVSNPPYSVKDFKQHLQLENKFKTLEYISEKGSEIETLFVERIAQLLKPGGLAAVILPSSILTGKGAYICARESLLQNFYIRAIVQLQGKTFGATNTNTNIFFLQKVSDPPERFKLFTDTVAEIFANEFNDSWDNKFALSAWLGKIKVAEEVYKNFILRKKNYSDWKEDFYFGDYVIAFENSSVYKNKVKQTTFKKSPEVEKFAWLNQKFYDFAQSIEKAKIHYFLMTFTQTTLIISAPEKVEEQEKFLGYQWSDRKGDEGIHHINFGGLLFDPKNRRAENKLAAAVRKIFDGKEMEIPESQKYFWYLNLGNMLDFKGTDFIKAIRLTNSMEEIINPENFDGRYLKRLRDICQINISKSEVSDVDGETLVSFIEMASVSDKGYISTKIDKKISEVRNGGYTYFAEGDIIIAKITPCMENGKCAIARNLTNSIGFGSTEFHTFRCDEEKILTEYLFLFLNRDSVRKIAQRYMTGTSGHRRVPQSFYSQMIIPVPSIDVQKKIVGEFSTLDEKISVQEKIILDGDAKIKNKFAEMFFEKNFPTEKIKNIFDLQIGKTPSRNNIDYWANGKYKWISVSDMGNYDRFTAETAEKISQDAVDETGIKFVPKNTVIMSFKLTIGRTAITSEEIFTNEAIVAFLDKKIKFIDEDYLLICLRNIDWNFGIIQAVKGVTLNKQSIGETEIPIPPKDLQEKFAEFVLEIEEEKNSARNLKDKFLSEREELVQKYFR